MPVIQVAADAFYAVKAGVWFTAKAATGPWSIATSVPAAIYTIPPSSRVFFATFARIYAATADNVFAGYTPGYLGAMRGSAGTVVYGTGYAYAPYLGAVWIPGPATYGVAAAPVYNRYVGYTFGFAMGLATPQFGTAQGAHYHPGYWGGYPCCGTASANVYKYWGRSNYAKARAKDGAPKLAAAPAPAAAPARSSGAMSPKGLPPPAILPASAPASVAAQQQMTMANRGYDMTMVSNADSSSAANTPAVNKAIAAANAPQYISAVEYYKSRGEPLPTTQPRLVSRLDLGGPGSTDATVRQLSVRSIVLETSWAVALGEVVKIDIVPPGSAKTLQLRGRATSVMAPPTPEARYQIEVEVDVEKPAPLHRRSSMSLAAVRPPPGAPGGVVDPARLMTAFAAR